MLEVVYCPIPEHAQDWGSLFKLLSLDLTWTLAEWLGIGDLDINIKNVIRPIWELLHESENSLFTEEVFASLGNRGWLRQTEQLFTYWKEIYQFTTLNNDYAYWRHVLLHCKRDNTLWEELGLPVTRGLALKHRFLLAQDRTEFFASYEEARAQPLSEWDRAMYARDDFHQKGSAMDPVEVITGRVALIVKEHAVWRWAQENFSADELERLRANALRVIARDESLGFINDLPSPITL